MKTAVVLMNLGTPAAPTTRAVRRYLREFLSDARVVEIPRLLWLPILYGPILSLRPRRVVPGYAQMWQRFGDSPLRVISQRQVLALRDALAKRFASPPEVALAMTYGEPRLSDVVAQLRAGGVGHILVLPLYPQFSATTAGPIYDQVAQLFKSSRDIPSISVVKDYHDHPLYIEALAQSVTRHWAEHGRGERLLMSFHGIPRRNVELGDPYEAQCQVTAARLAACLNLEKTQWQIAFQSRLGRAQWLQPYTSAVLQQWGNEGLRSVDVICPAFAADCLETLEEIAVENRHVFSQAGGGQFNYIGCLNDRDAHIELMAALVEAHLPGPVQTPEADR